MLIDSFAAPMFATNCWVLAPSRDSECVIVDPGMPDVSGQLEDLLRKHNLKPVAIIATHGHLDHTFSIQPIENQAEVLTIGAFNFERACPALKHDCLSFLPPRIHPQ